MRYAKVLCAFLGSVLAAACSMGGGANAARVVTGTITVPDNTYWANLKLGVFSGGALGTYSKLAVDYTSSSNVATYRVAYHDANDGSSHPIPPLAGGTYSISDTSGTSSSYSFELPSTIPQIQTSGPTFEYYYWAAWYDGTADGNLGLIDTTNATTGSGEEFNRCATKSTVDLSSNPTTIAIQYFVQSRDLNGNPTGNYKYVGYNGAGYNEQKEIQASNNSGFNFTISAQSGW